MPLYEYQCRACAHRFEILQRLGEGAAGLVCPRCGADQPNRQLSTFATTSSNAGAPAGGACGVPGCGSDFRCAN